MNPGQSLIMKTILWIIAVCLLSLEPCASQPNMLSGGIDKTIFVYGNGMERKFIKYVADLTDEKYPEICFITTASADHPGIIKHLEELTSGLNIRSKFLVTFISSSPEQESFADIIFSSDAVMVGGGNTLNMLGIWKAQGIDTLLQQAYDKGIVLAGGSAGSLCWFNGGVTDSRPKELSLMDCLGFLDHSHAPHYNDDTRRAIYKKAVLEGKLSPGYACEDGAGLLFINGEFAKSISLDPEYNNYFVSVTNRKISEKLLPATILK